MKNYLIDDMNYIGKCVVCGRDVTKDESYSNQYKNITCVGCVKELAEYHGISEIEYVMNYVQGRDERSMLIHACTVVFNKNLYVFDDVDINKQVEEFMIKEYGISRSKVLEIIDKYLNSININEIPRTMRRNIRV